VPFVPNYWRVRRPDAKRHGVALVGLTASRGGRSVEVNEAHVFHMRDGKVVEFWNASADQYAFDELIG
jgi:ketosteroid isomerase-like protein